MPYLVIVCCVLLRCIIFHCALFCRFCSIESYNTILYHTMLRHSILHCNIILYYIALYCSAFCSALFCSVLCYSDLLKYTVLYSFLSSNIVLLLRPCFIVLCSHQNEISWNKHLRVEVHLLEYDSIRSQMLYRDPQSI